MRYYPISIDTKDKSILVVGGGRASYLKLKNLVNTYALVTVVAREFCEEILNLLKLHRDRLILKTRTINVDNIDFIDEYNMAFICTDNKALNNELCKYFKHKKILVMMADNKENSDFITSSVLEKENITIAINTEGRSPTASKLLLNETEKILTDELLKKLDLLCKIREKLINIKNKNKNTNTNKKNIGPIMDGLALYDNKELEEKLRALNYIAGESKWK